MSGFARRPGKPIPEIFSAHGEAHFRTLERELIHEIAADDRRCPLSGRLLPAVIATGGGALVDERNFTALSRCGVVICLTARPEVIARRAGRNAAARPMLAAGGAPSRSTFVSPSSLRRAAPHMPAPRLQSIPPICRSISRPKRQSLPSLSTLQNHGHLPRRARRTGASGARRRRDSRPPG